MAAVDNSKTEVGLLFFVLVNHKESGSFPADHSQDFGERLSGGITVPLTLLKASFFTLQKKLLMHYLTQRSGAISRRILSTKMEAYSQDSWAMVKRNVTGFPLSP